VCSYIDVPNGVINVIRPWAISNFCCITANGCRPSLRLESPHRTGEQSSGDEVQEAGRHHQEDLKSGG
jgi:hypothetical protein